MQYFYFNECIPLKVTKEVILDKFCDSLREYNKLLEPNIGVDRSIITEKLPSDIPLGPFPEINSLIDGILDHSLRNFAYSLFIKHPIQQYFALDDEMTSELLKADFAIKISDIEHDATNLAITHSNGAFLFTVATHNDLKKNLLVCNSKTNASTIEVNNLFGEQKNTEYIEKEKLSREAQEKGIWQHLLQVLGKPIYNSSFKRDFENLRSEEQISIISSFQDAKARNLASPFYPDTKLIKDVTPQHGNTTVMELRVYTPVDLRVYFNENHPSIYLVKIEKKSSPNQSTTIKNAGRALKKLILTSS